MKKRPPIRTIDVSAILSAWFFSIAHAEPAKIQETPSHTVAKSRYENEQLREALKRFRNEEAALTRRWELDEELNFRSLPPRAWPPIQPKVDEVPTLQEYLRRLKCTVPSHYSVDAHSPALQAHESEQQQEQQQQQQQQQPIPCSTGEPEPNLERCNQLWFNLSTALVFQGLDPARGVGIWKSLAAGERVTSSVKIDSMVAVGICLIEGIGQGEGEQQSPQNDEERGVRLLQEASLRGSPQADFELASLHYSGLSSMVPEDERKALELYRRAAREGHIAAMFMTADCLLEGCGCDDKSYEEVEEGAFQLKRQEELQQRQQQKRIQEAVPLLYNAAESGHRFARQRFRELLLQTRE